MIFDMIITSRNFLYYFKIFCILKTALSSYIYFIFTVCIFKFDGDVCVSFTCVFRIEILVRIHVEK